MPGPLAFGNVAAGSPPPGASVFDQRMARASALAALATIFASSAYLGESGFTVYAVLFAIPYVVFALAPCSRKWQAWGWALAWVTVGLALATALLTTLRIIRGADRAGTVMLAFLMTLLLTQAAQLIFARRAFSGTIAFGRPLFRCALYYICFLLVVAATLPNWYVPPAHSPGSAQRK